MIEGDKTLIPWLDKSLEALLEDQSIAEVYN